MARRHVAGAADDTGVLTAGTERQHQNQQRDERGSHDTYPGNPMTYTPGTPTSKSRTRKPVAQRGLRSVPS